MNEMMKLTKPKQNNLTDPDCSSTCILSPGPNETLGNVKPRASLTVFLSSSNYRADSEPYTKD